MNLNVGEWKPFLLKNIFNIKYGVNLELNACEEVIDKNDTNVNFVSRTGENNGVSSRVAIIDGVKPQKSGLISIAGGGSVLSTFLQSEPFYSGRDLYTLECKELVSDNVKLFLITIIEQNKYKYSYGRQANKTMPFLEIILPIKYNADNTPFIDATYKYSDDGFVPDWQFMEDCISSLHCKPLTTSIKLGTTPKFEVDVWRDFYIKDLFELKQTKKKIQLPKGKCSNANDLVDGNDINYIGATINNNGVMKSCEYDDDLVSEGNCIIMIGQGEGSAGYAIYMDKDFIGASSLNLGYADWINQYTGNFVAAVLCKEYPKYSFGRSWSGDRLLNTRIKLPIKHNEDGTPYIDETRQYSEDGYVPDWQWMEDYIKSLPYGDRLGDVVVSKQEDIAEDMCLSSYQMDYTRAQIKKAKEELKVQKGDYYKGKKK